ncbi:MAG: hypothetical protein IT287_08260 [Bdellovibrionaceae bacterium]|nr:hypothetical protein [Pseudobdellovibrionaceae bacterium]
MVIEPPKQWLVFEDKKQSPSMAAETKRVAKETRTKMTSPAAVNVLQPENSNNSQLRPSMKELQQQSTSDGNDKKLEEMLHTSSDSEVFMNQSAQVSSSQRQQLQSFLPPDLELGDMVALNTDQNLFFTFYRRMAEKIIWPWAQSVNAGFDKLRAQGQLGATSKAWVTIVEVVLDKNGTVVSTQPLQLAGEWNIDGAPMNAFKSAKNFPNPPVEMIEEDGYIRIRYKFVVYYNPSSRQ